jgi:hypothetical protein
MDDRPAEAEPLPGPPASNRGFRIISGALALACVAFVIAIVANRPIKDTIAHAQHSLLVAQEHAERVFGEAGSFSGADADGLAASVDGLTFVASGESSSGLDEVSVSASPTVWAAAVQARPDACFYVRLESGADPRYGAGTECTGLAALSADQERW